MRYLAFAFFLGILGGCAQAPISANPVQSSVQALVPAQIQHTVETDLLSAEWNLDQAILIGALPKDDPADACLHSSLTLIGIEPSPDGSTAPPPPTFTPKNDGLVSLGAIAYVRLQQAKKLTGGGSIQVPQGCKTIIGQFVLDAGAAGVKAFPGAGILPTFQ